MWHSVPLMRWVTWLLLTPAIPQRLFSESPPLVTWKPLVSKPASIEPEPVASLVRVEIGRMPLHAVVPPRASIYPWWSLPYHTKQTPPRMPLVAVVLACVISGGVAWHVELALARKWQNGREIPDATAYDGAGVGIPRMRGPDELRLFHRRSVARSGRVTGV